MISNRRGIKKAREDENTGITQFNNQNSYTNCYKTNSMPDIINMIHMCMNTGL